MKKQEMLKLIDLDNNIGKVLRCLCIGGDFMSRKQISDITGLSQAQITSALSRNKEREYGEVAISRERKTSYYKLIKMNFSLSSQPIRKAGRPSMAEKRQFNYNGLLNSVFGV